MPSALEAKTLYDKLWDMHCVTTRSDGTALLYIDCHIIHEVSSAQAFEGLREAKRKLWNTASVIAVPDHNVPTTDRHLGVAGIEDPASRLQVETLDANCDEFDVEEFKLDDVRQGIVHVVGPEQGKTLPGMTVVCGDSHTSTHGAFAALAQGIGTSEVEHVLATQCLMQIKSRTMLIEITGHLACGVTAKDMALYIIGQIGTAGGTGYVIEFSGEAVRSLSMEARMTLCNMTIEAGARAGLIAFDEVTCDYIRGRPCAPRGDEWEKAMAMWQNLHTDKNATFDKVYRFDGSDIAPQVSWGTSPEMVTSVTGSVPDPKSQKTDVLRDSYQRALDYMGLCANQTIENIHIDRVFIGSCTNSRIEDIRAAATVVKGKKIADTVKQALVVPGSGLVKLQAESEGLDIVLKEAGFEWRDPGCSMCLAMNADRLLPGEHCASTSNRNFEGRQGPKGRTHLVSPAMAAAAAIKGHFVDIRNWE